LIVTVVLCVGDVLQSVVSLVDRLAESAHLSRLPSTFSAIGAGRPWSSRRGVLYTARTAQLDGGKTSPSRTILYYLRSAHWLAFLLLVLVCQFQVPDDKSILRRLEII
jgi:hypothetical protein